MSFRINTNIAAQGALRNVNQSSDMLNKSINRLSTGLRINNAADDPAGLIASEGFRSQISSIDQAVRNNQDAVNYAKTAEGALSEVNSLLNDARTLAVASANSGVLTSSQIQANQDQLNSIVSSISRISSQTQFGNKKLLDGSSGVRADVTDASKVSSATFTGQFNGASVNASTDLNVQVTTAATRTSYTSAAVTGNATAKAGTLALNGTNFSFDSGTSITEIASQLNAASGQTGVSVTADTTTNKLTFEAAKFGTAGKVDLVDSSGIISGGGALAATAGVDAVATVTLGPSGTPTATATYTAGRAGNDGLTLSDADGNTIRLSEAGNATGAAAKVAQVSVGSAQFQIGANQGQNVTLSLGNFTASNLGTGAVAGKSLANLDLSTATSASDAMSVLDKAISEVSSARGRIGNFQRNTLESNIRSLGVARENLSASESSIRDTDVAEEMGKYTKAQILQQAGLSVLSQANSAPQSVLALIRG